MANQKDPYDNSVNRVLDGPIGYGVGTVLIFAGVAQGWLYGWFAVVLLGITALGMYRWAQRRKNNE